VASIVIVATELCIRWNKIDGATSITPPGQIIPFLLDLACLLRVLYSCARKQFLLKPFNESATPLPEYDAEPTEGEPVQSGNSLALEQKPGQQQSK